MNILSIFILTVMRLIYGVWKKCDSFTLPAIRALKKRQFSERRFVTILWQIDVMDVKRLIFVRTAP